MKINLSGPDITQGDIDAVVAVLKTPNLSLGPKLVEFETRFADTVGRRCVSVTRSSDAGGVPPQTASRPPQPAYECHYLI